MQKNLVIISLAIMTMGLAACNTTPHSTLAIQKPNQQFEVTGTGKTQLIAQNNAIKSAQSTCHGKSPIVTKNDSKYQGALNEDTNKMINQAGGIVGAVLGRNISLATDSDYITTLSFYCQ